MHALREVGPHAIRRKYWDRAFGSRAISDYAATVMEFGNTFVTRMRELSSQGPINMSEYANFAIFDVMGMFLLATAPTYLNLNAAGVLGFDKSFEMLESGKSHFYLPFIESAMKALAIVAEIPWILDLLFARTQLIYLRTS